MSIINRKYENLSHYSSDFVNAKPYPHVVLDNFLNDDFFSNLDLEEMNINHEKGRTFDSDIEKNKWASKNEKLSDGLKQIIDELNNQSFLENL